MSSHPKGAPQGKKQGDPIATAAVVVSASGDQKQQSKKRGEQIQNAEQDPTGGGLLLPARTQEDHDTKGFKVVVDRREVKRAAAAKAKQQQQVKGTGGSAGGGGNGGGGGPKHPNQPKKKPPSGHPPGASVIDPREEREAMKQAKSLQRHLAKQVTAQVREETVEKEAPPVVAVVPPPQPKDKKSSAQTGAAPSTKGPRDTKRRHHEDPTVLQPPPPPPPEPPVLTPVQLSAMLETKFQNASTSERPPASKRGSKGASKGWGRKNDNSAAGGGGGAAPPEETAATAPPRSTSDGKSLHHQHQPPDHQHHNSHATSAPPPPPAGAPHPSHHLAVDKPHNETNNNRKGNKESGGSLGGGGAAALTLDDTSAAAAAAALLHTSTSAKDPSITTSALHTAMSAQATHTHLPDGSVVPEVFFGFVLPPNNNNNNARSSYSSKESAAASGGNRVLRLSTPKGDFHNRSVLEIISHFKNFIFPKPAQQTGPKLPPPVIIPTESPPVKAGFFIFVEGRAFSDENTMDEPWMVDSYLKALIPLLSREAMESMAMPFWAKFEGPSSKQAASGDGFAEAKVELRLVSDSALEMEHHDVHFNVRTSVKRCRLSFRHFVDAVLRDCIHLLTFVEKARLALLDGHAEVPSAHSRAVTDFFSKFSQRLEEHVETVRELRREFFGITTEEKGTLKSPFKSHTTAE